MPATNAAVVIGAPVNVPVDEDRRPGEAAVLLFASSAVMSALNAVPATC